MGGQKASKLGVRTLWMAPNINEHSKLLSIFNGKPSIFLAFRYLIGAKALKRHGKRNFAGFDYAYCPSDARII